ncbi:hypothetical protein FRC07_010179 [Ceratobasidium sp. 392]|nr:hypothetical protein FRC07_010179 [Ceratobasidium sp. 392]
MTFRGFGKPTQDWNSLAQLREWADHFKVFLDWRVNTVRGTSAEHQVVPIIGGRAYEEFSARDPKLQVAKNRSAELVISAGLPDRILRA